MSTRQIPVSVDCSCPHCSCDDEVEIVVETPEGWGCFCNSCGRSFAVRKPEPVTTPPKTKETL